MEGFKISQVISASTATLSNSSPSARLDVEILLAHVLKCRRLELLLRGDVELTTAQYDDFSSLLARRRQREPIAYITELKEFFAIEFRVTPAVLVPRPETEHLVEQALEFITSRTELLRIIDLGTGSGCIGISIATQLLKMGKRFDLKLTDRSAEALRIAEFNASSLGVADKCRFVLSDWFSELAQEKFDLILSNPPYISDHDRNLSPETAFEPKGALFSGPSGLEAYERLIPECLERLSPEGAAFFEIGADQSEALSKLCSEYGLKSDQIEILPDLAGLPRVLCLYN